MAHHISLECADHSALLQTQKAAINFARCRPYHIPDHDDEDYNDYKKHRDMALKLAAKQFEQEMAQRYPVEHVTFERQRLTVQFNSQSKLSQQELADLQKATHFDKKELQQWYKGKSLFGMARNENIKF